MRDFVEWAIHTGPTIIVMIIAVISLYGTNAWLLQGYSSIVSVSNLAMGFLSNSLKIIGAILGSM